MPKFYKKAKAPCLLGVPAAPKTQRFCRSLIIKVFFARTQYAHKRVQKARAA